MIFDQRAMAGFTSHTVLLPRPGRRIIVRDVAHKASTGLALLCPVLKEHRIRCSLPVGSVLPFCGEFGVAGNTCWNLLGRLDRIGRSGVLCLRNDQRCTGRKYSDGEGSKHMANSKAHFASPLGET
jgi:hypothetical protein